MYMLDIGVSHLFGIAVACGAAVTAKVDDKTFKLLLGMRFSTSTLCGCIYRHQHQIDMVAMEGACLALFLV